MPRSRQSPIGRNDPCYCGSGKKYKRCHDVITSSSFDAIYDRARRRDAESADQLLRFAKAHHGEHVMENAWDDFHFFDGTPFEPYGPEGDSFTRWFLFNWKQTDGQTLTATYISEQGARMDRDLRRFIEATGGSPYSFYQAIDVRPGEGLTMRDILRKREVRVTERSASTILKPGHILLARVVELDGCCFFMGTGAFVILPAFLDHVLVVREDLEKDAARAGKPLSDVLLEREDDLREAYFEIEKVMSLPPEIRNTDGDPLAFHTLTYEIPSLPEAFEALKSLEQSVTGISDEEMLAGTAKNKAGAVTEVTLHWLQKGYKGGFGDNTTLATLTIRKSRLVVDVNSERRARKIQKEIKKRLGDDAILLKTEVQPHEGVMREISKGAGKRARGTEHDRLMRESSEARAIIRDAMDRHWAEWFDEPVPALRGMTPRQAVKDPVGRELLESLLMDFELRDEGEKDEFLKVDIARLRRELRLEKC